MAFSDFRSRLFLITPASWEDDFLQRFEKALSGTRVEGEDGKGDIGCILIDGPDKDAEDWARQGKQMVACAQKRGVATLIKDNVDVARQMAADGVHASDPKIIDQAGQNALQEQGLIIGCAGINTRHLALQVGERELDYLFFGRTDREASPQTHPKTQTLSLWWAQMMAIPCVALSGTDDEAFQTLANSGVEFIGVREQIWQANDPLAEIIRLNSILDTIAHKRMAEAA